MPVRSAARADPVEKENVSSNRAQAGAQNAKPFDPSARRRPGTPTTTTPKRVAAPRSAAPVAGVRAAARPGPSQAEGELRQKLDEVMEENADLQKTSAGLEEERDYYWRKLRNVEIVCSTLEAQMDPALDVAGIIRQIQGILYAEKDEDEEENMELAVQPLIEDEQTSTQLETPADLSAEECGIVA